MTWLWNWWLFSFANCANSRNYTNNKKTFLFGVKKRCSILDHTLDLFELALSQSIGWGCWRIRETTENQLKRKIGSFEEEQVPPLVHCNIRLWRVFLKASTEYWMIRIFIDWILNERKYQQVTPSWLRFPTRPAPGLGIRWTHFSQILNNCRSKNKQVIRWTHFSKILIKC